MGIDKTYIVRSWYLDIDDDETVVIYHGLFTFDEAEAKSRELRVIDWSTQIHLLHMPVVS